MLAPSSAHRTDECQPPPRRRCAADWANGHAAAPLAGGLKCHIGSPIRSRSARERVWPADAVAVRFASGFDNAADRCDPYSIAAAAAVVALPRFGFGFWNRHPVAGHSVAPLTHAPWLLVRAAWTSAPGILWKRRDETVSNCANAFNIENPPVKYIAGGS